MTVQTEALAEYIASSVQLFNSSGGEAGEAMRRRSVQRRDAETEGGVTTTSQLIMFCLIAGC